MNDSSHKGRSRSSGSGQDFGAEPKQLRFRTWRAYAALHHMVGYVETGVVGPEWRSLVEESGVRDLTELGHQSEAAGDETPQVIEPKVALGVAQGASFKNGDRRHVHRGPHRLEVEEHGVERREATLVSHRQPLAVSRAMTLWPRACRAMTPVCL